MYDYINGSFTYKIASNKGFFVTIENNGIGYRLEVTNRDYDAMPELKSDIQLYTVLLHREDKMSFCGFLKRETRDIFNVLTSVSGVGSKMALTLLDYFEVSDLVEFVIDENYKELMRAKGVGAKLAQKIILELKDKINSYQTIKTDRKVVSNSSMLSENAQDAQMVMLSLGYSSDEVNSAIIKSLNKLGDKASAEDILKEALKSLAS